MSTQVSLDQHSIHIKHSSGASVSIAKLGATVYSWKTAKGEEQLFLSEKSGPQGPKPLRGGIPVVFPVFGPPPKEAPYDKLAQHGFARNVHWEDSGEKVSEDEADNVVYELFLKPTDQIKALYKPEFSLVLVVSLHPQSDALTVALKVTNPSSSDSLRFQALLHNYFLLPSSVSPTTVSVKGLHNLTFADKTRGLNKFSQDDAEVVFKGETDRVYEARNVNAVEASWGLKVVKEENLPDVVVWNPDQEKGDAIGDMHKGGWKQFVCLEPGHVSSWVELVAGGEWTGKQRLVAPGGK